MDDLPHSPESSTEPGTRYSLRNRDVFFEKDKRERGRVKHAILKVYFQAWLPILGYTFKNSKEIIFVDGFAGPGRHNTSEEKGSPLVVYEAAVTHCHLDKIIPNVRLIFVELDQKHAEELRSNLNEAEKLAIQQYPSLDVKNKVIVEVKQMRFDECMAEIFEEDISHGNGDICPMLVFADPFGYKGVPFEIFKKLALRRYTDVILNFMDSYMHRFIKVPSKEDTFNELFGPNEEWKSIKDKENRSAADFVPLYQKLLLDVKKNLLFLKFGMRDGRNRHVYHLVYFTKHRKGIEVMKKSMAKESQETVEFKFSEWHNPKKPMRSRKENKDEITKDLVSRILQDFSDSTVKGSQLEDYVLLQTLYSFTNDMCTKVELKAQLQSYTSDSVRTKLAQIIYSFPKYEENENINPATIHPGLNKNGRRELKRKIKYNSRQENQEVTEITQTVLVSLQPPPKKRAAQSNLITNYFPTVKKCRSTEEPI